MELAINIKNTREQHWVKIEDILYIQSEGNDCHFVTTKEEFKFRNVDNNGGYYIVFVIGNKKYGRFKPKCGIFRFYKSCEK